MRFNPTGRRLTCVVDQDVNAAVLIDRGVDQPRAVVVGGDVHRQRDALAAGRLDLGPGFIQRLLPPRADYDLRAFLSQDDRRRPTDAFRSARHDRHFALESEVHDSTANLVRFLYVSCPSGV